MISRLNNSCQRLFPAIQPDIYIRNDDLNTLIPDQKVAHQLLTLAHQKFARWERLTGWKLNALGKMGRLLLQHRLAMEAEFASQWKRADFFWQQVQIEIKSLSKQEDIWQCLVSEYANEPDLVFMRDPIQMRQRLIDELLIDTHCAFYNGLSQQIENQVIGARAVVHVDYIQKLLEITSLPSDSQFSMLEKPFGKQINLVKEAKKWQQAIYYYCRERLRYFPNRSEFQSKLSEIHWSATIKKLREAKATAHYRQNSKALKSGIKTLENCLQQYPYNLNIFIFVSSLYHLRAISLLNTQQIAEALVSIQKALTYNPHLEQAYATRKEIVEVMYQLQEQMKKLQQEIAQKYNARLNEQGQRSLVESQKGFGPINTYMDSDEAKTTARNFQIARAIKLWQTIGLPEPPEGWKPIAGVMYRSDGQAVPIDSPISWGKKVLQLQEEVGKIFQQLPTSQSDLADTWKSVVSNKPNLSDLDPVLIRAYIERQLFAEESDRVLVTPPHQVKEETLILVPNVDKLQRGAEPILPWLFSSQDKRIKFQAAISSLLVIVAGGIGIQDGLKSSAREMAYQQILRAEQIQDNLSVVQGSETFFANLPFSGKDGRGEEVMNLYTKSLVKWFAQLDNPDDAKVQKHLADYRQNKIAVERVGN